MKILRKALCFLSIIALLSIFSAISVSAAAYTDGYYTYYTDGYYTYFVSNGGATITDVNSSISGDVTIPASLGGYPVTGIDGYAFAYCSSITSVTIPDGVTYVGARSFYCCSYLAEVTIPPSLTLFKSEAFLGCYKLKTVNISDLRSWVESDFICINNKGGSNPLGYSGTLYLNGVPVSGHLVIPDGTKKIGDNVFFGYDNFTSITIPQSVESFGQQAFTNCRSLETIYISDLRQWCEFDFSEDIDNPLYYAKNLYLNGTPVAGEVVIPPGTKSICALAFYANQSITKITIPDSVKTIGERAFYGCKGVTTLELGNGLESVGERAFELLSSLKEVNIHDIASWCQFGFSLDRRATLSLNGEPISGRVEIPNGTVEITDGAFQYCKDITEVIIPTSVVRIGKKSFASCYGISNIDIYGSPTIGDAAFGWISGNAKISFYGEPQSIYSSQYTIYDGVDIWCYSDNSTVESYASKYGRQIHYFPCKDACSYVNIVNESYLKSEGSCTTKSVYYQSCEICLNASDSLTFEDDFCHSYYERPVADCLVEAATCTEAAVYYISCNCGTKNTTQTFVYGDPLGHSYDDACDESCDRCTFVREAPHNIDTAYEYDSHHHWNPCLSCELLFSYVPHWYDGNHDTNCNDCGSERVVLNLHYDANGGENPPAADYIPLGSAATVSSNVPTKDNFVFIGWATNANGVVEYEVGDTLTLTESITLYAVWKAECQECGGTGKQHTTRACTSCESGYVYSASCYYCYGRGKYSTGDMSCSNCYGSGQVKDPYGSGKYVNCLMCGGDGLVPDYQTCYHCRSKCTICNGSAKVTDYFDCENCDAHGYYDSFEVYYDANGGSNAPSSQTMGGKLDTLSETIPSREGFVFIGWNTLIDNNAVYQPGDAYCNGEVTFYAMWAPVCHSCAGEGHFTEGNTCGACNGNGKYSVTVKTCNSCGGNHVVTHVTGYGSLSYCSNCGSTSIKTSTQTKTCSNCTNGIVGSTYECEDCGGSGYVQTNPKALSFTDSKVVLLKIDGMEYSIDGINWQDSNVFTELLPGTGYSFYQRIKATENAPFGFVSAPLLLRTDKADNEDVPQTPLAVEITAESIRVDLISGCEYSIDSVNWQSEPLFVNLDCATNYTVYARFAETDTHYASQAISYTVVRTEKGTVSAPSMPTLVAVGRDRIILQKLEGYEYSIDGIHWQSSNAFLGLESKTNYFVYCRFAATDRYYASSPSEALTVKTLAESEVGPTYQITFQDEYGNILSQASYELYDEIVIPSTLKESDLTYTYTFLRWDKPISEFCMGEAIYTAAYEKKYIDYTVVFKDYNGDVISTNTYHYGDAVVVPSDPTRVADNTYTYAFAGWDTSVATTCSGSVTYTATYTPTYIEYTVKFVDEDNTPISTRTYHYGDTIVAPTNPTKASDNTYNYTFAGWDKAVTNCDGDATYKATYNSAYINYTVVFKNYNDDVISSKTYHYGDAVVVPDTPKKPSDENYCYVFVGWDKSVTNCFGDAVYTAKFTASDLPIVTVNNSSARANETVVVNILLSGAPNLGSLAISDISYNTSVFELVSVDWKVTDAILSNWNAATGKGALALSTAKDINGTIISLTFKVKAGTADGNYPVSCTVTSQECDFKNVAGQITVYSVAPGDVDGNESVDKDDAIYLLMHSFFPEDYPINQEADYNGNGMVDKDDAIHLLMYTFFPDDYPLAPAPAAVTITTTVERKRDEDEE